MFKDKVVTITGGTGSFGHHILKGFLATDVAEIRIFSRDEKKQEEMRTAFNNAKLKFYIGDVRGYDSIHQALKGAHYVFHAAALRDVTIEQFEARANELDDVTRRRARHVITENARTLKAAEVMRQGDAERMGELMDASHISMRDDFEISREEMDTMVALAQGHIACYGARMTGGGFGGCAVALVHSQQAQAFADSVAVDYQAATGLKPSIYVCRATDGVNVVV